MHRSSGLVAMVEEALAHAQGWLGSIAVVVLAVMLPLALAESRWVTGMEQLAPVTGTAAILGLALGRRRRTPAWAWVGAFLAGVALPLLAAGGVFAHPGEAPERLVQGVRRLQWWATVVWLGGSNDDPLAPLVVAGWAMWTASLWMGWAAVRLRAAMAAVLPVGVLLAANTFFGLGGWRHLVAFVPLSVALLVQTRLWRLKDELGPHATLDDSALGARVIALAAPVVVLALAVALILPPMSADSLADAFWERAEAPWRRVVRVVKWLFPGVAARGDAPPWLDEGAAAGLPAARELAGQVAPDEQLIMYVRTSDPPPLALPDYRDPYAFDDLSDPGPKRYWRGMTYDVYTGRGWANSRADVVAAPGGRPFEQPEGPREQVAQDFEILAPREELLYAVADPVALDSDLRLYWRGEGDLAFLKAPLGRYSVVSEVLQVTQAQLRSAGTDYPAWVRERYLTLPEVPRRVVDLTAEIVGGADNPYDRLVAIQSYLRLNYDYDLQVPEPAEGKDVVDYFLFESRRGFCDYYASAMVVMARLAGVPARLASGYATGRYDYASERYVVTAGQAHSWPEAYFPGLGWVEFEPTVVQSPFYRPAGAGAGESPQVSEAVRTDTAGQSRQWALVLVGLVVGAGGALVLVLRRLRAETDPVLRAYRAMEVAGARLGLTAEESLTPREYALRLAHRMGATLEEVGSARGNGREAAQAAAAVASVAVAYEQKRYGPPRPSSSGDGIGAWPAAERYLRVLAVRRLPAVWARRLAHRLRRAGDAGTAQGGASGPAEPSSSSPRPGMRPPELR